MQNINSLFSEAFCLMNSIDIESNAEDYYSLIHTNLNFNKKRKFTFNANREDYKKSIDLFEQVIAIKPHCKFAYNYCGVAKKCIHDNQAAILDFNRAIAIDPNYEIAHYNRGHTQFILKEYDEAIKDTSTAILLNEEYGPFYEIRGSSKNQLKDYRGAVKDYSKCINLEPDNYRVYRLRAFAYLNLKNFEKSIEDFNNVYDFNPANFGCYFSRGNAYFNLKKYKKAIEDLTKAAVEDPDSEIVNSILKEAKIKLYIEEQALLEKDEPTKKPSIINAFSTMDLSLLEVLLEDYKTYQDAPKETFLEKMNVVFEQFKNNKDTVLVPHKGKCNSKECTNKGCMGFSFIGNVSKYSVDLIFEETENNFNDICNCTVFKITDHKITKKDRLGFEMKLDEKANFSPSPSNAIIHQNCLAAYDEIIKSKQQILTKESLLSWLTINKTLYDQIGNDGDNFPWYLYRSIDNFRNLYLCVESRIKYIVLDLSAFEAIREYQQLDRSKESKVLKWLAENEELFNEIQNISYHIDREGVLQINYSELPSEEKYLDGNYKIIPQFTSTFEERYWPMLDKYTTLSEEESSELIRGTVEAENQFSLKHHLKKREII